MHHGYQNLRAQVTRAAYCFPTRFSLTRDFHKIRAYAVLYARLEYCTRTASPTSDRSSYRKLIDCKSSAVPTVGKNNFDINLKISQHDVLKYIGYSTRK